MAKEYWLRCAESLTSGWFKTTQRHYQKVERACGFHAPEGQDATTSFVGVSPKSGLTWKGQTWDPFENRKE